MLQEKPATFPSHQTTRSEKNCLLIPYIFYAPPSLGLSFVSVGLGCVVVLAADEAKMAEREFHTAASL